MALNLLLLLPAAVGVWLVVGGRHLATRTAATLASATAAGTSSLPSSTLATKRTGFAVSGWIVWARSTSGGIGTVRAGRPACSAATSSRSQVKAATARAVSASSSRSRKAAISGWR